MQFRTPEAVAADDDRQAQMPQQHHVPPAGRPPKRKQSFKEWLGSRTKKQWILIGVTSVIVLSGMGFAAYNLFFKSKPAPVVQKEVKQDAPKPAPAEPIVSKLTGLPITDASINDRPVTAVMIENSPDARPQSGLNQAGVVFEAVAEGGITRFVTFFQDSEPDYIGPVRSVRPYYVQWAAGFDAAIAHVGGSADALKMLRQDGVAKDLDQFFNPGPYHRVSNRFAPHNMYSSVVKLRELQTSKGFTSKYTGFPRKPEAKAATPAVTSIDFNISGALYNPHYDYDAATNTYKRSLAGKPHIDERSGQQLAPKVVIALIVPQGKNGIYTTYQAIGSGQAILFQDGVASPIQWKKTSNSDQIKFTTAEGTPVNLNPGQTWISVIGDAGRATYK